MNLPVAPPICAIVFVFGLREYDYYKITRIILRADKDKVFVVYDVCAVFILLLKIIIFFIHIIYFIMPSHFSRPISKVYVNE